MGGHRLLDALFLCSRFMNNYGTTKFSGLLVKSSLTVVPNHVKKCHVFVHLSGFCQERVPDQLQKSSSIVTTRFLIQ